MSDEEKEAKLELNRYIYGKNLIKDEIVDYLGIIFALIEKQSKEIEELKDKIKAKIEELEKLDFGTDLVSQFTANLTTITILQSLLEKE